MHFLEIFLLCVVLMGVCSEASCEELNFIFRDSALLHEVLLREVFNKPEDFLRLKLLKPQGKILSEFRKLKLSHFPRTERKKILKGFVENNFENVTGLDSWMPSDFKKTPQFLKKMRDNKLRQKLEKLNMAWLKYGRKLGKDVLDNPRQYSFIPVPKPFFVSSTEVQEMGYWESFWIFQGLMACDMLESAKNLMENICSMIDKLGHCPPYNRVYFRDRTSPPMLPFMMSSYLERTNDTDFLSKHVAAMDSDLTVWIRQRLTLLQSPFHAFLIIMDKWWPQIRPECYKDDIFRLLNHKSSSLGPRQMFWEADDRVLQTSVLMTAVTEASARVLAPWLRKYGYKAKARYFENISREMNYTLHNLLKIDDCWRDLHIDKGYKDVSSSSLWPEWLGTSKLPCLSAKKSPISTGTEAVVSGGAQACKWMDDVCRVNIDNLVDIASAFHIARTMKDLIIEQSAVIDSGKVKPLPFTLLVAIVLFRYWLLSAYK